MNRLKIEPVRLNDGGLMKNSQIKIVLASFLQAMLLELVASSGFHFVVCCTPNAQGSQRWQI